jgi:hypothetical protein
MAGKPPQQLDAGISGGSGNPDTDGRIIIHQNE